jgi:hypothetical protein
MEKFIFSINFSIKLIFLNLRKVKLGALLVLLPTLARAQIPFEPLDLKPRPELPMQLKLKSQSPKDLKAQTSQDKKSGSLRSPRAIPPQLWQQKDVANLSDVLKQQFQRALAPLKNPSPRCEDSDFSDYIQALLTAGDLDTCAEKVRNCGDRVSSPKALRLAALCETTRFHSDSAQDFFLQIQNPRWQGHPERPESLFLAASYSLYKGFDQSLAGILRELSSSPQEERLWKGVLQRFYEMATTPLSKKEIEDFLADQIKKTQSSSFRGLLLSIQLRILMRDSRWNEALNLLFGRSQEFENPLNWYTVGYNTLFYGLDQDFRWARVFYDTYNSFSHPWLNFPVENNTLNYSEVYSQECSKNLVPLDEPSVFRETQKKLRSGEVSFEEALSTWERLRPRYEDKADFLTALGGLKSLKGQRHEAMALYWKAHTLCPYYNRAHWGLEIEKRFLQYESHADFQDLKKKLVRELANRTEPAAISNYIFNWRSMDPETKTRILFGSRIFLPYMEKLKNQNFHAYMKYGFDRLSESPELSELQDRRIGGSDYPNDNRLWDDVRGVGGAMVVADISEVFNSVQGDYNLLGHEMAHQFQYLLETLGLSSADCIPRQFEKATKSSLFPDSYSSQNKEEHFAQGVTYYLVPSDSPARFGLNQSWLTQNNPEQFSFIQAIDQAAGDMNKISCPL